VFASAIRVLSVARELNLDLVFIDIRMPGISGLEFARLLKADLPQLKVVMITGFTDPCAAMAAGVALLAYAAVFVFGSMVERGSMIPRVRILYAGYRTRRGGVGRYPFARTEARKVQAQRFDGADPGAQHGAGLSRRPDSVAGMVRLQSGQSALYHRSECRYGGAGCRQYQLCRRCGRYQCAGYLTVAYRTVAADYNAQRRTWWVGSYHCILQCGRSVRRTGDRHGRWHSCYLWHRMASSSED
ncbi:MAG: response regulator, partial [Blastochloris sp.]|nr:response regulator [Blastochloris sp.]